MVNENDKERAQFEAWAGGHGFILDRTDVGGDYDYQDLRTQGPWEAWQAALAARQPVGVEPARISSDMVDGELSVASAINQVVELFPSADRAALRILAACLTHHSIHRYATPPAPAGVPVDKAMVTAAEDAAYAEMPWNGPTEMRASIRRMVEAAVATHPQPAAKE
ncbi:hypothetical protein [Xanthomonas phage XAJ2]|uniref:Uncharacterized protein n=1 Tax=Xanthomonas phage XAJ2 TaxID=1775249 RepID=A0A1I9L2H0_9CAUD|nr:hypothetical protein [Xanthomonas phage XAJ2]